MIASTRDMKLGHVQAKKEARVERANNGRRAPVFMPKWTGPWEVIEVVSPVSVRVVDPSLRKKIRKVHVSSRWKQTE